MQAGGRVSTFDRVDLPELGETLGKKVRKK